LIGQRRSSCPIGRLLAALFFLGDSPSLDVARGVWPPLDADSALATGCTPPAPITGRWRTLAAQVPLTLHGVSLGLASTVVVDDRRLERMARLLDVTGAETWSEHLAFVRGGVAAP
jgi:Protein of unknown function (DUF692)